MRFSHVSQIFLDADVPARSISWRQYVTGAKSVAVGLQARGLHEQDCVALLSRNDIYISILGDAVAAAGAVFSGLPAEAKESELIDCCNTAQVKLLFAMPDLVEQARNVARRSGIPDENVLIYDPPGLQSVSSDGGSQRGRLSSLMMEHEEGKYSIRITPKTTPVTSCPGFSRAEPQEHQKQWTFRALRQSSGFSWQTGHR